MIQRRGTAGTVVDPVIDRLISDINVSVGSSSTKQQTGAGYIDAATGAYVIRAYNNSGGKIIKGGLLMPSLTTTTTVGITYASLQTRSVCGVSLEDWPPRTIGKMVIKGPCEAYFDPNGSTFGDAMRISFPTDHALATVGMAHSENQSKIAGVYQFGRVFETRVGEGLAWCVI